MVKAGDVCERCRTVVRVARFDASSLADTSAVLKEHLVCDCLAGPLGGDED
jgi:hypothetical protein